MTNKSSLKNQLVKGMAALLAVICLSGGLGGCASQQAQTQTRAPSQASVHEAPSSSTDYCQYNSDDCNNHQDIFIKS